MFLIPAGNRFNKWRRHKRYQHGTRFLSPAQIASLFKHQPVRLDDFLMEPPSYEEASRHPPHLQFTRGTNSTSAPAHRNATSAPPTPPTPPPTYREAVRPDVFPVLTPLSAPVVIPPSQTPGVTVHPITQIGEPAAASSRRAQTVVVVSQPPPVPITVTSLRDAPGLIRCPRCNELVTTEVKYVPGCSAWCTCVLLALFGLFCGFCLIPLWMRRLQDAHHSCPRCREKVHVYER